MKAFYQEILKREGGKRNLTAADVSEVMRHAAEILVERNDLNNEFEKYLCKKASAFFATPVNVILFMRQRAFGIIKGRKNTRGRKK